MYNIFGIALHILINLSIYQAITSNESDDAQLSNFSVENFIDFSTLIITLIGTIIIPIVIYSVSKKIESASLETEIENRIINIKLEIIKQSEKTLIAKKLKNEVEEEVFSKCLDMLRTEYLNAFDIACSLYIHNKIDKLWFERAFRERIKEVYYRNKDRINATKYPYLISVYEIIDDKSK